MLKFIKKLLKYILILAIIAAVIGSVIGIGVYYWEKNEDKKDQVFNQKVTEKTLVFDLCICTFFLSISPDEDHLFLSCYVKSYVVFILI